MPDIEKLIRERHSVRSYLNKEIEKEKSAELIKLITSINETSGLNIQLVLNDHDVFDKFILHYGRLKNCSNYIALIGKNDDLLDEKVGYFGEKLVLKAQELGLNTCWVAGTYKKSLVKASISSDERLVCVIALGYGETNGNQRRSKTFEDVNRSDAYPEWYKRGIEYALLAPTAMNEQKFMFEYLGDNSIKVTPGIGSMTKVDLGIVKYHFELGAQKDINWC